MLGFSRKSRVLLGGSTGGVRAMAGALPPWRKTGRKAKHEHFTGLTTGAFVEFVGYDDRGRQQGRILGCLAENDELHAQDRGITGLMHVLAIEDGYYEYWHEQTFGVYMTGP